MSKQKILCLHGYGTNANFMKKQSVALQKVLQRQIEFIFVDAPFPAPENFVVDQKVIDLIEGEHKSWFPKANMEDLKEQFFEELDKIRVVFEKASDHYDGILGFSQGAVMTYFLLKLRQMGIIQWRIMQQIRFSIIMNSNSINYSLFKTDPRQVELPSFHIISPQDFMYPKSIIHMTLYKNPQVVSHSYGHKFPKLGVSEAKMIKGFIRKYTSMTKNSSKEEFQVVCLSSL